MTFEFEPIDTVLLIRYDDSNRNKPRFLYVTPNYDSPLANRAGEKFEVKAQDQEGTYSITWIATLEEAQWYLMWLVLFRKRQTRLAFPTWLREQNA